MKTSLTFLFVLALVGCGTEAPAVPSYIECPNAALPSRWPRIFCERATPRRTDPSIVFTTVEGCASDQGVSPAAMPVRDPVSTHPYANACAGFALITATDARAVYP